MSSTQWGSIGSLLYDPTKSDDDGDDVDFEPELAPDQEELEYESFAASSMTLPGMGEAGENCQTWAPFEFCDECGEPKMGMNRCERRGCPNCYHRWEVERTVGGVTRLAKARYAEEDGVDRRAIHAVISPPPGEIKTLSQWRQGYRDAQQLAKEQGIRGGVMIGHGFRVTDSTKRRYRRENPEVSMWHWIRDVLPESWRSHTYWSPHYHVIGLSRDFAENKPEQQDGWNCVRMGNLDPYSGTTDRTGTEDMIRPMRYILDHASYESETTRDCVRWFGSLSTATFSPSEEISEGAENAIERVVEEMVGNPRAGDEASDTEADADDGADEECGNCGSTSFSSIYEAGSALADRGWCDRIGRDQQRKLQTAFEWAIGEIEPPPGMKNPATELEAREAFQELLPSRFCQESKEGAEEVEDINPDLGGESGNHSPATQVGASDCNLEYGRHN